MGNHRVHIEKRFVVSLSRKIITSVVFILLSLVFSSIFIIAKGFNPFAVYSKMISYSFFSMRGVSSSIMAGIPLMFCGLSVAFAFNMNINNIGAEGQYAFGAIVGGGFALFGPDMPLLLKSITMFSLAAIGGAFWAMIAAALKSFWNVSETIVTLMLNYIALLYLEYLTYGPWMATGQTTPTTATIPKGMYLPNIGNTGINSSFLIAIALAVIMQIFFKYSTAGYQMEVIKHSKATASYAAINVSKYIFIVLCTSGAIAGITGYAQVAGTVHRLQARLPGGSGYTGIVIAYLSQFNPYAVILVSILFGGLVNSGAAIQVMGVPSQIVTMIQGSMMIFVIAGEYFNNYKVRIVRSEKNLLISDQLEDNA